MSDKLFIAKMIVRTVVGVSTSKVAHDIIVNNTTVETGADAAKVWVGGIVIGAIVTEHAKEFTETKIDNAITWYDERKSNKTAV